MSERQHMLLAIAAAVGVLILGAASLLWPRFMEIRTKRSETAMLRAKVRDLSGMSSEVEQLARDLEAARHIVTSELKHIPESPDVAKIMHKLSLPADGKTVLNQEFAAGSLTEITDGQDPAARAIPLTVDMRANFDSVFALIRATEQLDDLVRVSSIRLAAEREQDEMRDTPLLLATVGLEVLGELPPMPEEEMP